MTKGGLGRMGRGSFPYHLPNLKNMNLGGYTYYFNPSQMVSVEDDIGCNGGVNCFPMILPTPIRVTAVAFRCNGLGVDDTMYCGFYSNYDKQGDFWCSPYPYQAIWRSDAKIYNGGSWYEWSGLDIYLPGSRLIWLCSRTTGDNETLVVHRGAYGYFNCGNPVFFGNLEANIGGFAPSHILKITPPASLEQLPDPMYQVGPASVWGDSNEPAFYFKIA
jgi:hypothetical protein